MRLVLVVFDYNVNIEDPCCYPLGFMYVSSALKAKGHEVKVLNCNLFTYDFEEEFSGFDAVLFTGFEAWKGQIKVVAALARLMGLRTILGGSLATFCADEMLNHLDTVVVGEGEAVIEEALHTRGKVNGTTPDIDSLPLPDYEGFGVAEYHRRHSIRYMGVLTTRGCPFSCTFCAHTCRFRVRDLGKVMEEIDLYQRAYGIEVVIFNDNTLNVGKERFLGLCREMKARRLGWGAAIRLDLLDEEMTIAAKESGARHFVVGVESFRQEKLDRMNKKMTVEQITKGLDLLEKHRVSYHGNVMFGFKGESEAEVREELAMLDGYNLFPTVVQPFIGTTVEASGSSAFIAEFRAYAHSKGMEYWG